MLYLDLTKCARTVVAPLEGRDVHHRVEYRHYNSNRHYCAYCHDWLFSPVKRFRRRYTVKPALFHRNYRGTSTVMAKAAVGVAPQFSLPRLGSEPYINTGLLQLFWAHRNESFHARAHINKPKNSKTKKRESYGSHSRERPCAA